MTFGEVGRLAEETARLSLRLAEATILLGLAAQWAWLDAWGSAWAGAHRLPAAGAREARARTDRLIGRGVPPEDAARGLRLV